MTAPPIQCALKVQRGVTWSAYWTVYNPDGSGNVMDLTGWSAIGQVRPWYGSADLLFAWPDDAPIECLSDGKLVIHVEPAQSSAWDWDRGVYGVELSDPSGNVVLLAMGPFLVTSEVVV